MGFSIFREHFFGLGVPQDTDGIAWVYDKSRDKRLSLARIVAAFGRDGVDLGDGTHLLPAGAVLAPDSLGYVLPRDSTVTRVTGRARNVGAAGVTVLLRSFDSSLAESGITSFQFAATPESRLDSGALNHDVAAGEALHARLFDSTGLNNLNDPLIFVELAWRIS